MRFQLLVVALVVAFAFVGNAQSSGNGPCPTAQCSIALPQVCVPILSGAAFGTQQCNACRRRCAYCIGDPHCWTFDGVGLHSQWVGEAVLIDHPSTGFRVHGIAVPIPFTVTGGGGATVLSDVFIQQGVWTLKYYFVGVIPYLQPSLSGTPQTPIALSPSSYFVFGTLTHRAIAGSFQICSTSGHIVHLTGFNRQVTSMWGLIASVDPRSSCSSSATRGLLGSPDGVDTNDFRTPSGSFVSITLPQPTIYTSFTLLWVYPTTGSYSATPSIAYERNFEQLDEFIPFFGDSNTIPSCHPSCNGDFGCCLDYQIGGSPYLDAYLFLNNVVNSQTICCPEAVQYCDDVQGHCDVLDAGSFDSAFPDLQNALTALQNACHALHDECTAQLELCPLE